MRTYLYNPFFLFASSWSVVLFCYQLNWSQIYPSMSCGLYIFLYISIIISLILSINSKKKNKFRFKKLSYPLTYYTTIIKYIKILYVLLIIEFIEAKSIPLIGFVTGNINVSAYIDFGIPLLHVVILNSFFLLFYISAYCYFSSKGTDKKKFVIPIILCLLAPILFMSRGSVMYMIFSYFLLFIMSYNKKTIKLYIMLVISFFLILYGFGRFGDFRMQDNSGHSEYIQNIGKSSDTFRNSVIPKAYFWSYLYISSPIATLQNAIDTKKEFDERTSGPLHLVVNEILPMFISKRIGMETERLSDEYRIANTLTVGSTYLGPYLTWGWKGIIIIYIYIMFLIYIMERLIPKKSIFYIPMILVLSNIAFFSLFDNMLIYMGLCPQLVLIYLLRKKYASFN